MSEAAAVQVVKELRDAVREAIALGLDGEAIAGLDLLVDRFPDLVPNSEGGRA